VKADKYFVKTKSYNEAYRILSEKNLLVLTGLPGEGKTTMAAHLALEVGLKPENCVKLECARDWEDVNWSLRCFTVVIIDDIFGEVCLDPERLSNLKKVLKHIEHCAIDKTLKVIITSRSHIIEEANDYLDKITMFKKSSKHLVHLNSRCLSADERRHILKSILMRKNIKQYVDLDECVKNAMGLTNLQSGEQEESVFGFPQCSALFATDTLIGHGPGFFKRPECHFKSYIEQLFKSKDKDKFY